MKSQSAKKKREKETAEEDGVKATCGEKGLYMRHGLGSLGHRRVHKEVERCGRMMGGVV